MTSSHLTIANDLIEMARKKGAQTAEAIVINASERAVTVRLGKREATESSQSSHLGLRVFDGKRSVSVSSSDLTPSRLEGLVDHAMQALPSVTEDPWCGLVASNDLAKDWPDVECCDTASLSFEELASNAKQCEAGALAVAGINNSEGGSAGQSHCHVALATSEGFSGEYDKTTFSLSCSVIAGQNTAMERDYDYSLTCHLADLRSAEDIGRNAAERALKRLNPRKTQTGKFPVIFDWRVARSLLGHLANAITGDSIARKSSFLTDKLGQQLFSDNITIIDDPYRKRGLGSMPFDGEGSSCPILKPIEQGKLTNWLLTHNTAKQLGMANNGRAHRSTRSVPTPGTTNLYMEAGEVSVSDMISDIKQGLYVTELIGFGVNDVTGDYSRGASGFWIENGQITYPVSEITIASNLLDMYQCLIPANDLEFRGSINTPSVRVDCMTIAGQ